MESAATQYRRHVTCLVSKSVVIVIEGMQERKSTGHIFIVVQPREGLRVVEEHLATTGLQIWVVMVKDSDV